MNAATTTHRQNPTRPVPHDAPRAVAPTVRAIPDPARRGARADEHRPEWLNDYLVWQRAQGISAHTYLKRRHVVEAFISARPDALNLTDSQVDDWLDTLPVSHPTRATYRTHLRAFFRWAHLAGRAPAACLPRRGGPGTAQTPTAYGSGRVLMDVAPDWREPIASWVAWLQAAARSDDTVYLREAQVRRLAAELPHLHPWHVITDDLAHVLAAQPQWSAETKRSVLSAVRSFFGWALATGRTTADPTAALARVRQPHRAGNAAPENVIAAALDKADPRIRLMILLASQLGLRRAEVARVHANDVRHGIDGVYLRVLGKGNRERVLPVVGDLSTRLQELPPGWAFPGNDDGHLSPRYVGKILSTALGPGWTAHTLRHRFATIAYSAERDLFAVQELLGHTSPVTTRRYVQLPRAALWEAVSRAAQ